MGELNPVLGRERDPGWGAAFLRYVVAESRGTFRGSWVISRWIRNLSLPPSQEPLYLHPAT